MLNIEVFSFATAALFFLSLSLVLLTGRRGQILKSLLATATLSSALWAGVVAYQAAYGGLLIIAQLLELLRELTWFAFLLLLLRTAYSTAKQITARFWITLGVISAFTAALMLLALYRISGGSALESIAGNDVLAGHLLMAIGGLVIGYAAAAEWLDALPFPAERVVIGGFSQGAVMSYALGLGKGRPRPAALLALSGFMPEVDGWEPDLEPPFPPIAIVHGEYDPVISVEFARTARSVLEAAGAEPLYRELPIEHWIDPAVLPELRQVVSAASTI